MKIYYKIALLFAVCCSGFTPVYSQYPDSENGQPHPQCHPSQFCGGERLASTIRLRGVVIEGSRFFTAKGSASDIIAGEGVPLFPAYDPNFTPVITPCSSGPCEIKASDPDPNKIGDVDFRSGREIILTDNFSAPAGCSFHAYIDPAWENTAVWEEEFNYPSTSSTEMTDRWDIVGDPSKFLIETVNDQDNVSHSVLTIVAYDGANPTVTSRAPILAGNEPYGKYVSYAKTTTYQGINTAIWVINGPVEIAGKYGEELELLERAGNSDCRTWYNPAYFNYNAFGDPLHENTGKFIYDPDFTNRDLNDAFHYFAVEWEPDEIRWLFDDYVVFKLPSLYAASGDTQFSTGSPYNFADLVMKQPMYWKVNANADGISGLSGNEKLQVSNLKVYKRAKSQ